MVRFTDFCKEIADSMGQNKLFELRNYTLQLYYCSINSLMLANRLGSGAQERIAVFLEISTKRFLYRGTNLNKRRRAQDH